jgi:hypothetical protein
MPEADNQSDTTEPSVTITSPSPQAALAAHAQAVFSDSSISSPNALNMLLQPLIATFQATSGWLVGNNGEAIVGPLHSVIHTGASTGPDIHGAAST